MLRTGSGFNRVRATDPDPGWRKFLIVEERVVLSETGGSWRMKVYYEGLLNFMIIIQMSVPDL